MSITKKTLLNSDGKVTAIDPTRELDEVFSFLREKNGPIIRLDLSLTNDRRGGNIYNLRRNPAVWCVCYPEDHPMAQQLAEIFRELQSFCPVMSTAAPEDHR